MATKIKAGKELRALLKETEDIRGAIADANYILKSGNLPPKTLEGIPRICKASVETSVLNLYLQVEQLIRGKLEGLLEGVDENVSESDTESEAEG